MHASQLPDRIIGIDRYLATPEARDAVHLTDHKDSGTKQILREKRRPAGTGFRGLKFRDFSVIWHVC